MGKQFERNITKVNCVRRRASTWKQAIAGRQRQKCIKQAQKKNEIAVA